MIVIVAVVVAVIVVNFRLYGRRLSHHAEHHGGINDSPLNGQQRRATAHPIQQAITHRLKLARVKTISAADQHLVSCLELIFEQLFNRDDVIKAGVL